MTTEAKAGFRQAIEPYKLRLGDRAIRYGLGAAWLEKEGEASGVATLERAYEGGFRYFDTSINYGESEPILGKFVQSAPRDRLFLATKSRVIPQEASAREAAELVACSLNESLRRLRTDRIDLYQLHDIRTLDNVLDDGGVLKVLRDAQAQGVIRFFGVATRNLALLAEAVRSRLFDTVLTYSDYTPICRDAAPLIESAAGQGIGLINASPLGAGLLTGPDPREIELGHAKPQHRRRAIRLYDFCSARGISIRDLALHFPLRNPLIDMTLTGPRTVREAESTLASLNERIEAAVWTDWEAWREAGEEDGK